MSSCAQRHSLPRKSAESYRAKYPGYDPFVTWAAIWGDTKREGVYTCEEWKQYATKVFNDADRNHDGFVDAQEFEAIRKADRMFRMRISLISMTS